MISKQGLMVTNHHCAYGDIFKLSTKEHNYLEDGFWAMTRNEEKHIAGKNALFLRKVIDVTTEVNELKSKHINNMGKPMMRRIYSMIE
jgi:Peptidase S46.